MAAESRANKAGANTNIVLKYTSIHTLGSGSVSVENTAVHCVVNGDPKDWKSSSKALCSGVKVHE